MDAGHRLEPPNGAASAQTLSPDLTLTGSYDVESRARNIPASYIVKGMFFSRLRSKLGDRWSEVELTLERPPRLGHFMPFTDYLQSDYMRICGAAAAASYPNLPLREGLRRLARDDFAVFAASTFGKVVLAAVGDVHRALLTTASIYGKMAPGDWTIRGEELDARTVRVEFLPDPGSWEYKLGQLEGVVMHFGARPLVTVSEPARGSVRFDVVHR